MWKIILIIIFIPELLSAAPFLVYDSSTQPSDIRPTHYLISVDAGPFETIHGEVLRYDMGTLQIGAHVLFIRVCNQWGCREPVVKKIRKFLPEPLNEGEFRIEDR